MPPLVERLELAEVVLRALGQSAELPAKIGVHPRQSGSLAQAMPALLRGAAEDGHGDLMGVKWIVGFPDNPAIGLPTYHAQVILSDSRTGLPLAILDAGTITAQRTAAVSGAAIKLFAPAHRGPTSRRRRTRRRGPGTRPPADHRPVAARCLCQNHGCRSGPGGGAGRSRRGR